MIAHRKFAPIHGGPAFAIPAPANDDDFGTGTDPRRSLSTDRRFVKTTDDRGHAGRAT
jgi:hypothetical protein